MSVFFQRRSAVPDLGKKLSDYAEGDIILLPENSVNIEFYVAKHDYESGLNGTGRTLIVRKDCYDQREWHSSLNNVYSQSDIDYFLNINYKALLGDAVKNAIGQTKFYYTPMNGNTAVATFTRGLFLLSMAELGIPDSNANVEGSALPITSKLRIAYKNGSAVAHWTRTPAKDTTGNVFLLTSSGGVSNISCTASYYTRPCFTLPANLRFDSETNTMKG